MQKKFIDVTIIEDSQTHYIVELTEETKSIFCKPVQRKVKMFKEKRFTHWRLFSNGQWIEGTTSESLNAFISTGRQTINF